jgi:hypothetical protein
LSQADRDAILGANAIEVYRLMIRFSHHARGMH